MGDLDKADIEDLTGCIPLYLDECVVDGKINLDSLEKVGTKAAKFTKDTRKRTKKANDVDDWELYGHPIQFP